MPLVAGGLLVMAFGFGSASAPALVYSSDPTGGAPTEVLLPRLSGDGTRLEGRYAMVYSDRLDSAGAGAPGIGGAADYRYQPLDPLDLECKLTLNGCSPFE